MSKGDVERSRSNNGIASVECIILLCSIDPTAILDNTHAPSYLNEFSDEYKERFK